MAGDVSVAEAAVQGGIKCCKTSIEELGTASKNLQRGYQQAGSAGWKDSKYAALGGIIDECTSALTKPISELNDCMSKLEKLLEAVQSYEQVGF